MTDTPDFDVREFSRILARLPEHTPISDDFEEVNPQERGAWYSSQRHHPPPHPLGDDRATR